jgi:hypothetical protein
MVFEFLFLQHLAGIFSNRSSRSTGGLDCLCPDSFSTYNFGLGEEA